jgi:hypothetical protein
VLWKDVCFFIWQQSKSIDCPHIRSHRLLFISQVATPIGSCSWFEVAVGQDLSDRWGYVVRSLDHGPIKPSLIRITASTYSAIRNQINNGTDRYDKERGKRENWPWHHTASSLLEVEPAKEKKQETADK